MSDRDKIVAAIFAQADAKREMYEENERLRAENEKLKVALNAFMSALSYSMRAQGWSNLDVMNNDAYRAAAAAIRETNNGEA